MKNSVWMKLVRMAKALLPSRDVRGDSLSPVGLLRRFGGGNINLQMGRVMFADEYERIKSRALNYDFR